MRGPPEQRNAAPVTRDGGYFRNGFSLEGTAATTYSLPSLSATEYAANLVARRHRLTPPVSRLVCDLAGLGGAA